MNSPNIDKREAKDILAQIRALAKQYVPEWRYDAENPDVGVVLSEIFSNMFENTISTFNKTPYNHYVTFINMLGAKLLPPISSTGMVTVDLIKGTEGVFIKKGTSLYAEADNDEGRVYFETTDAMFAIDSTIQSIFMTNSQEDSISKVYDCDVDDKMIPFKIFNDNGCEDLQSHEIYFEDKNIFNLGRKANIKFKFYDQKSLKNNEDLPYIFSNMDNVSWQYYNGQSWENVQDVQRLENEISIAFDEDMKKTTMFDTESYFLKCVFKRIPNKSLKFTDVSYKVQNSDLNPDVLLLDDSELSDEDFFPFGEQYGAFTYFYISSEEAFLKRGSSVKINFDMQFVKIKLNTIAMPDNTQYRHVMSDLDFKEPEENDIEIERVSWEYWNGKGWAKIYNDNKNEDFFTMKSSDDNTERVLEFICPDDMEPILLGPKESCFIRAKILKVKNPFSVLGSYISPYIHKVSISYEYIDASIKCEQIHVRSNMEERTLNLINNEDSLVLDDIMCEHPAMYFCLNNPIKSGPVKLLFDIEAGVYLDVPSLKWEYYSKDQYGNYKWKNIDMMDLTKNLSNSAIVSMIGKDDFAKTKLFGKEGYFFRVVNHDDKYYTKKSSIPVINGIYMNTVQIEQIESRVPEYFSIENMQANKVCKLSCTNILHADVWVNEFGNLSSLEEKEIVESRDDSYIIEYNDKGRITEIWVKWEPVESISFASMNDRVFEIDYNKGNIIFGDGKHGKIPSHQEQQSIKVEYSISSGTMGNIGEEKIQGFSDSIPYISSVKNLKQLAGGVDMETVSNAADRMASKIAGLNRIVSLDDFESSIRCNDRNIYKVRCLPHIDNMSRKSIGTISIAILPKDYMQGNEKFSILKERVEKSIKDLAPLTLVGTSKLNVFEVVYVEFSVKVDLVIDDYNYYQSLYRQVYSSLESFLNPIYGNFNKKGWDIGSLPRKELVYNYIKSIKNIKRIKSVNLFTKAITLDGKRDVSLDEINKQYFTVPVFGEPEINIIID